MGFLPRPAVTIALVASLVAFACGSRTALEVDDAYDRAPEDAAVIHEDAAATRDASAGIDASHRVDAHVDDAAASCAPSETLVGDVFGTARYYANGVPLPAGRYRVTYVDGCMKYSGAQDWAVHAYDHGSAQWSLIGDTPSQLIVMPPGTVGFLVGSGGYATFDECVTANLALAPIDFDFNGGRIGLWLEDSPYTDNVPGLGGRNPTWRLDCVK